MIVLKTEQLNKLHDSSLVILSETGVNVHSAEVRDLLENAGAEVQDELRVRIPAELVTNALATAPSRIDICNRSGNEAMILENENCYFGTGSDLKCTLYGQRQQRRISMLKDVELSARLCEELSNIDFVMSYALPNEVPSLRIELEQLRVMLNNTAKPIIMTVFSGIESFEQIHKLACESCGGAFRLQKAPFDPSCIAPYLLHVFDEGEQPLAWAWQDLAALVISDTEKKKLLAWQDQAVVDSVKFMTDLMSKEE